MASQRVNSNNGKVLKSFEQLNNAQLEKALTAAENGFHEWKQTSYAECELVNMSIQ